MKKFPLLFGIIFVVVFLIVGVQALTSEKATKNRYEKTVEKKSRVVTEKIKTAQRLLQELNEYTGGNFTFFDFVREPEPEKIEPVADISGYEIRTGLSGQRKNLPTITGTTVRERSESWLDSAGLGYTIGTWERLASDYKVYYTLPICIAWADSHLGQALKSTNNIGNVGNNDKGNVVHYNTLDEGIEAIYRTLNNKWMGGSQQIGHLSGEGRTRLGLPGCNATASNQKCYATSTTVWSTNVTNCMSVLHDKQIDETFYFRLNH